LSRKGKNIYNGQKKNKKSEVKGFCPKQKGFICMGGSKKQTKENTMKKKYFIQGTTHFDTTEIKNRNYFFNSWAFPCSNKAS